MNTQSAPVSDQARRTARRVAALLANADALLITAGAGMSLDCDPPDNPDLQYLQGLFDATGRTFRQRAQPAWFDTRPQAAWAWYGVRERIYKHTRPHDGYRILRAWAQAMPCGSFVATTNIDGLFFKAGFTDWQVVERHGNLHHYQCTVPCSDTIWDAQSPALVIDSDSLEIQGELPACPRCGAVARPNVLMYDDVKWLDAERREQQLRFDAWLASVRGQRLVVIECGAGEGSASVRRIGERLLERSRVSLVRINPTATEARTRAGHRYPASAARAGQVRGPRPWPRHAVRRQRHPVRRAIGVPRTLRRGAVRVGARAAVPRARGARLHDDGPCHEFGG